jgi:hemerythrin superfamily protein
MFEVVPAHRRSGTTVVRNRFHREQEEPMADTKKQDAIALLKADHDEVRQLFKDFEKAGGDGRKEKLARQICRELTIHSMIEEEIFYPACEGKVDEDLLKEGYVEHDAAKLMIAEIEAGEPSDEFYDSKVKVLSEEVDHHIQEEEKRMEGLFSQARRAGLDMDQLGERLARRKAELTEQTESGDLPAPELTTMDEASV